MHATAHCQTHQTHDLQFKLSLAAKTYHLKLLVDPPLQLISSHRTAQIQVGYKSSLCPAAPGAGRCHRCRRRPTADRRHRPHPPTPCHRPPARPPCHLYRISSFHNCRPADDIVGNPLKHGREVAADSRPCQAV